jgi:hypothetical protein
MKFNGFWKKTGRTEKLFEKSCRWINKYFSFLFKRVNLEWDQELEEAIEFTKLGVKPREVIVFAWFMALFFIILFFVLGLIFFILNLGNLILVILIGFTIGLISAYYLSWHPKKLASLERIRALSHAPELVAYLIIPLKQNPNLEEAVKFAAKYGEGEMASDLKKALFDVWAGKYKSIGESLPLLGKKWGEHIKGFEDAMYAIRTSQIEKSETRRLNTLDRALDSVLKSIQKRFEEFINYLRLPTMVLFAGGALFPLVVITLLPLISFIGMEIGTPVNLFLGLMFLLFGIFLFSDYTLRKRPATFPFIQIPDDHPALPSPGKVKVFGKERSLLKISLGVGVLISSLSLPFLLGFSHPIAKILNTLPIIIGISLGLLIYLRGISLPKKEIRDEMKETEDDAVEATFQLGNRLLSGMSAEEAFVKVADLMSKPKEEEKKVYRSKIKEIFERAVRNIKYMNLGLEDALFDEKKGALRDIYSGMIKGIFRIFIISMKRSIKTASEALITAANHIREIRKVEGALKDKISYTTQMMKLTATVISPAICALTVYIAEVFRKTIAETQSAIGVESEFSTGLLLKAPTTPPEILQLIVGIYMLLLLIVLVRYVTILENGDDPVLVKLEISRNIPIALITFIAVLFVSKLFV